MALLRSALPPTLYLQRTLFNVPTKGSRTWCVLSPHSHLRIECGRGYCLTQRNYVLLIEAPHAQTSKISRLPFPGDMETVALVLIVGLQIRSPRTVPLAPAPCRPSPWDQLPWSPLAPPSLESGSPSSTPTSRSFQEHRSHRKQTNGAESSLLLESQCEKQPQAWVCSLRGRMGSVGKGCATGAREGSPGDLAGAARTGSTW